MSLAYRSILSSKSRFDPDALAFINATGITDSTQQNAINTLVIDIKGAGLWTKMKAIYPFIGGTATTHKFNLKDPRDLDIAYRITFGSLLTHSANGVLPATLSLSSDTHLPANAMAQNSAHMSYYSRTNEAAANKVEMGSSGTTDFQLSILWSGGLGNLSRLNSGFLSGYIPTKTNGYFIVSRTASAVTKKYEDNSLKQTVTTASTTPTSLPIYIFSRNGGGFNTTKQCAFATIGDGIDDTEASNLYTIVQAYQTTLGRNV